MELTDTDALQPSAVGVSQAHVDRRDGFFLCIDNTFRKKRAKDGSGDVRIPFTDRAFPKVADGAKAQLQISMRTSKASDHPKFSWARVDGWPATPTVSLDALWEALRTCRGGGGHQGNLEASAATHLRHRDLCKARGRW